MPIVEMVQEKAVKIWRGVTLPAEGAGHDFGGNGGRLIKILYFSVGIVNDYFFCAIGEVCYGENNIFSCIFVPERMILRCGKWRDSLCLLLGYLRV